MTKICFIHNIINNTFIDEIYNEDYNVCKKNLFKYPKIIQFNYEIGNYIDEKYNTINLIQKIITPRCLNISQDLNNKYDIQNKYDNNETIDITKILDKFIKDIYNVNIIICEDCQKTFNYIFAECLRYNIYINISNITFIDCNDFYNKIHNENIEINDINMLKQLFFKTYNKFIL